MKKMLFFLIFISNLGYGEYFDTKSSYEECFTPAQECTAIILRELDHAKKEILIQAYSLTDPSILTAINDLHVRGIDIKIIIDKNQVKAIKYLSMLHIPLWIDRKVTIQHNKVIIIDGKEVLTGSFNFSKAANMRNAENLLIIKDKGLAQKYKENWLKRQLKSSFYGVNNNS
jgi:phosphatidylserine/phosphatidylglycerophosphate/cardiolipin synthase-like enzyme